MLPKLYITRTDVPDHWADEFVTSRGSRHLPDLVDVGFYGANGYQAALGGPWSLNICEILGGEVFGQRHNTAREEDPRIPIIMAEKVCNHSLTIYDHVHCKEADVVARHPWAPQGTINAEASIAMSLLNADACAA
jgi:hypothetical protein